MTAYYRPETLEEALRIRAGEDVMPIAGGTDVYPAKVARAAWGDMRHKSILDLTGITRLKGVQRDAEGWRAGALATWSDIAQADLPAPFDALKQAARCVGGVQIQNRGTLVGNICTASPAGDGAPALLALDAQVEIAGPRGTRRVPLGAFITGYRATQCARDELVTAILLPPQPSEARSAFAKLGARRYLVISIAMVAAVVTCDGQGIVRTASIAVGACSATPRRLDLLERALVGTPLAAAAARVTGEHVAMLDPIDDIRASAAYRRAAAQRLVGDVLEDLADAPSRRVA